ncbi:MAG: MATE family efflux transporter [Deltaproteobacteria bacterium]|nr:MATE family efflux transporter [Deltaproteobacteria bacterium]
MFPRAFSELRALLLLGFPIIVSNLAHSAMGLTDIYLVAPLGPEAIGAVGLGGNVFFGIGFSCASVLLCLDTLVSQAIGRGDRPYAARVFMQSLGLGACVCAFAAIAMLFTVGKLDRAGLEPSVVPLAKSFVLWTVPGLPALFFTFAASKYLQAHDRSLPVMLIAVFANVFNYGFDVVLIYGRFGFPALGVEGAAIATTCARWVMALGFALVLWRSDYPLRRKDLGYDRVLWNQMLILGVPAAAQVALEIGLFVMAGFLIARFEADALAAHYVMLQLISFTFMAPLGVSNAVSVRVGHAIGAGLLREAAFRGKVAIGFSAAVMSLSSLALIFYGRELAHMFGARESTTLAFLALVPAAAAFQIFDGVQVTATGALRGVGDTRSPFLANVFCHWLVAFPIALYCGFSLGWRAPGVWLGLSVGLISVALMLIAVWVRRSRRLSFS